MLADLARSGDNKKKIVEAGGVVPLVAMLSSDAPEVRVRPWPWRALAGLA